MGGVFSDLLGIEGASDTISQAVLEAEGDASAQLRYVLLTALNYVKSFTPIVVLIMVFLILLLLVSVLFVLNRVFIDLEVSLMIRRCLMFGLCTFLYIWFIGVLIAAAIKQKRATFIIAAIMACLGLVVVMAIFFWFIRKSSKKNQRSLDSINEMLPTNSNAADRSRPRTDYTKLSDNGH